MKATSIQHTPRQLISCLVLTLTLAGCMGGVGNGNRGLNSNLTATATATPFVQLSSLEAADGNVTLSGASNVVTLDGGDNVVSVEASTFELVVTQTNGLDSNLNPFSFYEPVTLTPRSGAEVTLQGSTRQSPSGDLQNPNSLQLWTANANGNTLSRWGPLVGLSGINFSLPGMPPPELVVDINNPPFERNYELTALEYRLDSGNGFQTTSRQILTIPVYSYTPELGPESTFNYQTFGVWEEYLGVDLDNVAPTSSTQEWFSVGQQTPTSNMPTTGTATYNGVGYQSWYSAGGGFTTRTDFLSSIEAVANFSARTMSFVSVANGWESMNSDGPSFGGTLSISGASFSGSVHSDTLRSNLLSGQVTGKFYGPSANEIGGTFNLSGGSPGNEQRLIGSFGAADASR